MNECFLSFSLERILWPCSAVARKADRTAHLRPVRFGDDCGEGHANVDVGPSHLELVADQDKTTVRNHRHRRHRSAERDEAWQQVHHSRD